MQKNKGSLFKKASNTGRQKDSFVNVNSEEAECTGTNDLSETLNKAFEVTFMLVYFFFSVSVY